MWSFVFCLFCIADAMEWPLIKNSPAGHVSNCARSINLDRMRLKPDYGCSAKHIIHPSIKQNTTLHKRINIINETCRFNYWVLAFLMLKRIIFANLYSCALFSSSPSFTPLSSALINCSSSTCGNSSVWVKEAPHLHSTVHPKIPRHSAAMKEWLLYWNPSTFQKFP